MVYIIEERSGITVVIPDFDSLSAGTEKDFKDQMATLLNGGTTKIAVDLSNIEFVDSCGLAVLVVVHKAFANRGAVAYAAVAGQPAAMFKLSKMNKVFALYDTVDEAISALKA